MSRLRDDIDVSLTKKGFRREAGDHFFYIYWNLAGKKTLKRTKMSRGSSHKIVGDPLLGAMSRQIGVSKKNFLDLVDCTLDQAGYEAAAFSKT